MKNIIFFPTINLPIPAIKGGAIEALITDLIDENEIKKQYNFYVVTTLDTLVIEEQKKYKFCKFINIKKKKTDKFFLFFYKALKKITKGKIAPLFLNRVNYKAYRMIKKINYDFLICEGGYYRDFFTMSKKFDKNKMILHLHSKFNPDKYIESAFSKYISVSEYIKNEWQNKLKNKNTEIYVLKNCINQDKFLKGINAVDVRKKYNLNNSFVVMYVGRIVSVKGVEQLINAFIKADMENSKLVIVGSVNFGANETSNYQSKINELIQKYHEKIVCTGFVKNSCLASYMKEAGLIVMPSLCDEAAGLVGIESLLLGKDILITNSGGLPEYAQEKYCYIIDKNKYTSKYQTLDFNDSENIFKVDWSEFEDELAEKIKYIYNLKRNGILEKDSPRDYIKQFDSKSYFSEFAKMIESL